MSNTEKIIMVRETLKESVVSDLFTFSSLIAVVGIGAFLGSIVLQWVGFLFWVVLMLIKIARKAGETKASAMTPDQARVWLDENFPDEK